MKRFAKAAVALFAITLLPVLAAQPAVACDGCFDHTNAIRVSNRATDDRTVKVIVENPDDGINSTQNIGARNTYTWRYGYYQQHARIKVTVIGGGRTYTETFEANKPARDLCFRYSASGSFHPANDCKI